MESNIENMETKTSETMAAITGDTPGMITTTKKSVGEDSGFDWELIVDFLGNLPEQLGKIFSEYKRPITTSGIIIAGAVTVYVTMSVLDAIDHIPLLSPILELVGLGYSVWFITRYLLKASTRQELFAEFDNLKEDVLGDKSK